MGNFVIQDHNIRPRSSWEDVVQMDEEEIEGWSGLLREARAPKGLLDRTWMNGFEI
jgi:hypothetical protein